MIQNFRLEFQGPVDYKAYELRKGELELRLGINQFDARIEFLPDFLNVSIVAMALFVRHRV